MSVKAFFLTIVGFVLLAIGALGVVLPVLPTTPFVLVASACFAGNPTIRSWLLKNKFFHEHLINYQKRKGLKKSTVALSLGFLWTTLSISMLVTAMLWCTLLLMCVGTAVTIHILCMAREKRT